VSQLELNWVCSPVLKNVSGSFGPGLHVLVGAESDGTADLIELCAGVRLPQRGRLKLDCEQPGASPKLRRRIASLLPDESWVADGDVRRWLGHVGALHGFDASAHVADFYPGLKLDRALASLSGAERRELALAAALAQPEPKLVALHEPLAAAAGASEAVLPRLAQLGSSVPVLLTTRSIEDARRLGGQLRVLERGILVRELHDAWPGAVTPGLQVELWAECDAPRRLLAELVQLPQVERAAFDARFATRVQVLGNDLEQLARAVARAALAARVELRMLRAAPPELAEVHAASAGLAQAAYRAAQAARRGGA
jgi:ABC-2 type transport system ATP-binding protein